MLRALGLGDLLTAVPALRAVRRAFPADRIVLATGGWLRPLVDAIGVADEVLDSRELEPVDWHGHPPDVAVNLHGKGPESTALLAALSPELLIAWGDTWDPDEHEVHRWCRLLVENGVDADPRDLFLPDAIWAGSGGDRGRGASAPDGIVLHPGGKDPLRRWPRERWVALARRIANDGVDVFLTGSEGERDLCTAVATEAGLPAAAVLAGEGNVLELAATIGHARAMVSGDTGAGHLATAVGTPSVLLFGVNPPARWGPPPERRDRHRVLWKGPTGLDEISVDEVWDALALLLGDRFG